MVGPVPGERRLSAARQRRPSFIFNRTSPDLATEFHASARSIANVCRIGDHSHVIVESLAIPADLRRTLAKYAEAARHFAAFPPSVMRSILEWVQSARQQVTRTNRIEETARLAAKNVQANRRRPWKVRSGALYGDR
jgi:hypothetical protein